MRGAETLEAAMEGVTAERAHEATVAQEAVAVAPVRGESRAARAHRVVARVLFGALALQLFFAGLGVFNVSGFLPHAILGTLIVAGSFALPIIAWRGHLPVALTRRSWLLAALMILQGLLIDAGRLAPIISALHPVTAMLLVLVTFSMVGWGRVRG